MNSFLVLACISHTPALVKDYLLWQKMLYCHECKEALQYNNLKYMQLCYTSAAVGVALHSRHIMFQLPAPSHDESAFVS